MKVWPRPQTKVRYIATWAFSIRPAVPVCWRWTPTVRVPFFR